MDYKYNNIFQTHKSIEYINSKPKLCLAVKSWLTQTAQFKYFFYDDNKCNTFMKEIVGGKIYEAYQCLPIKVMKADLWRYCVIYHNGGIYADTDTICKVNPEIFIKNNLFVCSPERDTKYFCQWVFAAPCKSPILKKIIDLSVERILNIDCIKGEHIVHYLTGPSVFTEAIILYLKENNIRTPRGSWINSVKQYFIKDDVLYAELYKVDRNTQISSIKMVDGDNSSYKNNNGNFEIDIKSELHRIEKYTDGDKPELIIEADECKKYIKCVNDHIYVFELYNFHINTIYHLGAGSNKDGWKKERNKKLT